MHQSALFLTNDKLATKTLTVTALCIVVNNVSKFLG